MSNSLNAIGLFNSSITTSASDSKTQALKDTLTNVNGKSDEELMEACKSFEAYFLEQVFKGMEKTVMKSEESSSATSGYSSYYKDKLLQEYAQNATEAGGYGIAQMLYESMKR